MRTRHRPIARIAALAAAVCIGLTLPTRVHAAQPTFARDDGAYVRLLGNPADGTVKFQFGWSAGTPASGAVGYWVGVYDVTHSHYVWSSDTGPIDLPDDYFGNARPTADLPNGEYKVNFFVRGTYEPATNLAEIEFPFTVTGV